MIDSCVSNVHHREMIDLGIVGKNGKFRDFLHGAPIILRCSLLAGIGNLLAQ